MHLKTRNVNTAFTHLVKHFDQGNLDDIGYQAFLNVVKRPSRNGNVLMINEPVTITYTHPRERVLFNSARDANPFFHLYEALWMLAGRNDVDSVAYYAKQMREYSDNGKTLNGAYGYRWRHAYKDAGLSTHYELDTFDQLKVIVDHLKADPNSRRAVISMWNAEDDLLKIDSSKDVCCNLNVMFSIREERPGKLMSFKEERGNPLVPIPGSVEFYPDRYLDMTVINRSNDMIWGLLGANFVHFTFLQEYLAARIGAEVGKYHHFTNNLHVYDWNWKPDKWLEDSQQDWYSRGAYREQGLITDIFPLVKDPYEFNKQLPILVDYFDGSGMDGVISSSQITEPFLWGVARPALLAFSRYKNNKIDYALEASRQIKAHDWEIACTNWLKRRDKRSTFNKERELYHDNEEGMS